MQKSVGTTAINSSRYTVLKCSAVGTVDALVRGCTGRMRKMMLE
jgi:hypothetical protein